MIEVLLIDGQLKRGNALALALREHGVVAEVHSVLPPKGTLPDYRCLICLHQLIDETLTATATMIPTIVLSESGSIAAAVTCIRRGAADYLVHPVEPQLLLAAIERAIANTVRKQQQSFERFPMIGSSAPMRSLKRGIAKVAPTDSTVLILGQSGTGKELVARALHAESQRSTAPLISINCATVPVDLIEAELFGWDKFTAAQDRHRGLIEAAEGGTLFLDEIAEVPAPAQARLLRVMQGETRKVGSTYTEPANVRIIAATHRDLAALTDSGKFRQDLYYRLNVVCFELPPLQQRRGDALEIAAWLLQRTCTRLNKVGLTFAAEAISAMEQYHWPGNVRELENAIERAVILADNNSEITQSLLAIQPSPKAPAHGESHSDGDQTSLEDYFLRFVLDHQDQFTETELAEKLGISRKSLWERRQRLNIPRRKTRKRGPRRDAAAL